MKLPIRGKSAAQKIASVVTTARDTKTKDANVITILNDIQAGKWRVQVEQIRTEYARAVADGGNPKKSVACLKKSLPGVLWSGQFSNRNKPVADKLIAHSGLLCADLDDLGERILEVRGKLVASPHLFALFTSPTGNGIKAIFPIAADAQQHQSYFHAVADYVLKLTGMKLTARAKTFRDFAL